MKFKHEDLEIFTISMELVKDVYLLAERLPVKEQYGLRSQLTRSVTSIPLNISEGSGKHSSDDFARFIRNAIGSLLETDTNIKICVLLNYLGDQDYQKVDKTLERLYFKLIAFHKRLKSMS